MKEIVSHWAGAQREIAEFEPRVDLSMGRKIIEIPWENEGFQRSWGVEPKLVAAESAPRVALSMGTKIIEIP